MSAQEGIAWIVHTHEHTERTVDWYWALGLGAVVGAGFSIFFGNILLAFIIVIGAASIGTLVARGPRTHWVRVDARGISMDGTLYPYSSIRSFYIEPLEPEHGRYGRLLVSTSAFVSPQLVIPTLEQSRAAALRSYLKK